jgi:hypothetical protein
MLYDPTEGSNRLINHIRRCAFVNGTTPGRGTTATTGGNTTASAPTARAANPATEGASNTSRTPNPTPNASPTRATTRVADNEFPPKSKNESKALTRSTPNTSANTPTIITHTSKTTRSPKITTSSTLRLLGGFDEYFIGYKDRSPVADTQHHGKLFTQNGIFFPLLLLDGTVVGTWKRTRIKTTKKNAVSIALQTLP